MKRQVIALLMAVLFCLCLSSAVFAAPPAPELGTITATMSGNNYDFEVHTWHAYGYDLFKGGATGALDMYSKFDYTNRGFQLGANDFDRWADFTGNGGIYAQSYWEAPPGNLHGKSQLNAFVESDTSAFFNQNLHMNSRWAGVHTHNQWSKQRALYIEADGSYKMGFTGIDKLAHEPNYAFNFYAHDAAGAANLFVKEFTAHVTGSAGIGPWYNPDHLTFDYLFNWTSGGPGVAQSGLSERGYDSHWGENALVKRVEPVTFAIDELEKWAAGRGTIN
jgi:hypothetical protein